MNQNPQRILPKNVNVKILFKFPIQTSKAVDAGHELDYKTSIGEWNRRDIQYCRFPGYDLTYAHYSKFPS